MQRTKIVVSYTHTHNLGNYSNVKPGITIEAALDEHDDPAVVTAALHSEAVGYVHEAIDQALERDGQRAHFSGEPRYQVLYTETMTRGGWRDRVKLAPPEQLVVIVPQEVQALRPGTHESWWSSVQSRVRLVHAHAIAARHIAESEHPYRLVVLVDGDLTRLPLWALEAPPEPAPAAVTPAAVPAERSIFEDDEEEGEEGDDDA